MSKVELELSLKDKKDLIHKKNRYIYIFGEQQHMGSVFSARRLCVCHLIQKK